MDSNRLTAYNTLLDIEKKSAYSNMALNGNISRHRPDSPEFVRELVYGVLENKILEDYILDKFVKRGVKKLRAQELTVLRMGLYQLIFMDSVPDYAAINESVALARKFCRGKEGFVNAVLRNYLRNRDDISFPERESQLAEYLSLQYSCSLWLVNMWLEQFGEQKTEDMLKWANRPPEFSVRVNLLKTDRETLKARLEKKGIAVRYAEHSRRCLHLEGREILSTEEYKEGLFSVQDQASVMAADLLGPEEGDTVIDMCAAPGGKTLAMAEMMNNRGKITACDIYEKKLNVIAGESRRLGINIVETSLQDASVSCPERIGTADCVLADVPCSGLGVIRRKPEIKYNKKQEEIEKLPEIQSKILEVAADYVKPGGNLLYSTCTVNRNENDLVVDAFLEGSECFEEIERKQLFPDNEGTDGFFMCKMRRVRQA